MCKGGGGCFSKEMKRFNLYHLQSLLHAADPYYNYEGPLPDADRVDDTFEDDEWITSVDKIVLLPEK